MIPSAVLRAMAGRAGGAGQPLAPPAQPAVAPALVLSGFVPGLAVPGLAEPAQP